MQYDNCFNMSFSDRVIIMDFSELTFEIALALIKIKRRCNCFAMIPGTEITV